MFAKTKTTHFKCKASKTHLRKSCDLASTRSVSIPSGCRGSPERSDAMARITVASSSLHIEQKGDMTVRAFSILRHQVRLNFHQIGTREQLLWHNKRQGLVSC